MHASQVRNIVEILLVDFLEEQNWDDFYYSSIHVATASLTKVDHVDYIPSKNQVEVSFGGLVYFEDGSIGVPSEDALTKFIVDGLNQDGLLLQALQEEFPQLSSTTLGILEDPATEAPSMAPTLGGSTDLISDGVQAGINVGGRRYVSAVVGSIAGGFILISFGALFLLLSRRKRGAIEDEDHLRLELDLEKEGVQGNIQQSRWLDDTLDDAPQPTPLTTSTNNSNKNNTHVRQVSQAEDSAPESPKSFSREEPPPSTSRLGQIFAAAASLPQRMLLADSAPVQPEKMPDEDDDMASDFRRSAPKSPKSFSREEPPPSTSRLGQMFAAVASLPQRMLLAPSAHVQPVKVPDDDDDDDDDTDSEFEMTSFSTDFSSSVVFQPHIMPMESFEHQRPNMTLKKDMMMSRADI
jgi:hypothetical protein